MFQMDQECEVGVDLTHQFLQSSLSRLPEIPQLRLHVNSTVSDIETKFNIKKKRTPSYRTAAPCNNCYTSVDLNRAKVRLNVSRSKTLNIECHLCQKLVSEQDIVFSREEETRHEEQRDGPLLPSRKKKSKRDRTAGLTIPPALHSKSNTKKTGTSRDKLQLLLAGDYASNKSSLKDFLQTI